MHYKFDILNLLPGDILLSRSDGIQADIIGEATSGHFSHAMLYVGGTIIHADSNGVYSKNPQRLYSQNKNDLAVYRLKEKISDENIEIICKKARSEVGKLYDLKGAISSVRNGSDRSIESRQFCSKLVGLAFDSIKISFGKPIDKLSPNDFYRSELLERKDHVIPMEDGDFEFAISPDYNLDLQIETFEWLSEARNYALKNRNRIIGSINDVFNYLIEFPEDDEIFCKIINESRYYGFSDIDKEKNPYRYDFNLFKKRLSEISANKKLQFIIFESIGLDEEIMMRKNNYFWALLMLAERDILFFRKNHELARDLYMNATTRRHIINLISEYKNFVEGVHKKSKS
jgi:hypothetical protein